MFQRILRAYATKLFARLPKGGTGIVAAATGTDGQIKVFKRFLLLYVLMLSLFLCLTDFNDLTCI